MERNDKLLWSSTKLQNRSVCVADRARTAAKCETLEEKSYFLTFLINVVTSLPTKDAVNSGALGSKR